MPGQTIPQPHYMTALQRGNRIRLERAELRRDIKAGRVRAVDVIAEPPECAQNMTIGSLLTAQMRWGDERARKHCKSVGLPELKPLGALTPRQRALVAFGLTGAANSSMRPCRRGDGSCLQPVGHDGECVTIESQHGIMLLQGAQTCLVAQN